MPLLCENPIICHCCMKIQHGHVESPSQLTVYMCHVVLSVGDCTEPAPPVDGAVSCRDVNNLYRRCSVTCNDGKTFLRPVPKFFSCGPMGLWNTDSPMNTFHFPACGGKCTAAISAVHKHVYGSEILVKILLLSFV